jgi:hypothetical protein
LVVRGAESAGDLFLYKDKKMNLAELWILILSSCLPFSSFISLYVCHTEQDARSSHWSRCAQRLSYSNTIETGRQHVLPATLGLPLANWHQRKFTHPTRNFFRKIKPDIVSSTPRYSCYIPYASPHISCVIFSPMYLLLYSQTSYWKSL